MCWAGAVSNIVENQADHHCRMTYINCYFIFVHKVVEAQAKAEKLRGVIMLIMIIKVRYSDVYPSE